MSTRGREHSAWHARAAGAAAKRLRQAGFTLSELLTTVIIVGLVTSLLATGATLATTQYTRSMALSESFMLYSTLEQVLDNELTYTQTIYGQKLADGTYNVTGFDSKHYIAVDAPAASVTSGGAAGATSDPAGTRYLMMVDDDGNAAGMGAAGAYGQLALCSSDGASVNRLLGKAAYNYNLVARIDSILYNPKSMLFTVSLNIAQSTDLSKPLVSEVFTVRALNTVHLYGEEDNNNSGGGGGTTSTTVTIDGQETVVTVLPPLPPPSDVTISTEEGYIYQYNGEYYIANNGVTDLVKDGNYSVVPGTEGTKGDPSFVKLVGYNPETSRFNTIDNPNEALFGQIVEQDGNYYVKVKDNKNNSNVNSDNWCLIKIVLPTGN